MKGWPWPAWPTPKSALVFILQKPFSIDHNAMSTLCWIAFNADTESYAVWYEQQNQRTGTSCSHTWKIMLEC